jgi:hypothetical protein
LNLNWIESKAADQVVLGEHFKVKVVRCHGNRVDAGSQLITQDSGTNQLPFGLSADSVRLLVVVCGRNVIGSLHWFH